MRREVRVACHARQGSAWRCVLRRGRVYRLHRRVVAVLPLRVLRSFLSAGACSASSDRAGCGRECVLSQYETRTLSRLIHNGLRTAQWAAGPRDASPTTRRRRKRRLRADERGPLLRETAPATGPHAAAAGTVNERGSRHRLSYRSPHATWQAGVVNHAPGQAETSACAEEHCAWWLPRLTSRHPCARACQGRRTGDSRRRTRGTVRARLSPVNHSPRTIASGV